MGDKKGTIAKTGAVSALKCGSSMRLSAEETHRRCHDNGSRSCAAAQKSAAVDRNLTKVVVMIAHSAPRW
jgi:hypothetical protein